MQAEQTSKSRPNSAFVQSLKNQVSSLQTIFKKKQPNPEHLEEQDEAPKEEIVKVEPKTVQEPMGKAYSLFDLRFFTFGRKKKASNEPVALPETVAPVATTETVTEKVEAVVEEAAENKEAVTQAPPKKSLDFKR